MEILVVIVAINLIVLAVAMVIVFKKKTAKIESEPEADLSLASAESEKKEDLPASADDLNRKMTEFPGSHRQAVVSAVIFHKKPMARYETARGGWSWAQVVAVYDHSVLLRRQGTEFVRTLI